jgi:hypothetical protein
MVGVAVAVADNPIAGTAATIGRDGAVAVFDEEIDDGTGCKRSGSMLLLSSDSLESLGGSPEQKTPLPVAYVPSMRSAMSLKSGKEVLCHFFCLG